MSQTRVKLRPRTHCDDPDNTKCVIETGFPKLDLARISSALRIVLAHWHAHQRHTATI